MQNNLTVGQTWIYNQSLRPYIIIKTTTNDIHYVAATITPASGKIFIRSRKDFLENFTEPDKVTNETVTKAVENTLTRLGILKG
jgi:hypothetical protein